MSRQSGGALPTGRPSAAWSASSSADGLTRPPSLRDPGLEDIRLLLPASLSYCLGLLTSSDFLTLILCHWVQSSTATARASHQPLVLHGFEVCGASNPDMTSPSSIQAVQGSTARQVIFRLSLCSCRRAARRCLGSSPKASLTGYSSSTSHQDRREDPNLGRDRIDNFLGDKTTYLPVFSEISRGPTEPCHKSPSNRSGDNQWNTPPVVRLSYPLATLRSGDPRDADLLGVGSRFDVRQGQK